MKTEVLMKTVHKDRRERVTTKQAQMKKINLLEDSLLSRSVYLRKKTSKRTHHVCTCSIAFNRNTKKTTKTEKVIRKDKISSKCEVAL